MVEIVGEPIGGGVGGGSGVCVGVVMVMAVAIVVSGGGRRRRRVVGGQCSQPADKAQGWQVRDVQGDEDQTQREGGKKSARCDVDAQEADVGGDG